MQMVTTVILRSHAGRVRWIPQGGVKIDDGVESSRSSYPLIDCHALGLAGCIPRSKTLIRKNGRAKNLEPSSVRARDDLFVSRDDFIRRYWRSTKARIGLRSLRVGLTD